MKEPNYDPTEERPYECFECGNIVTGIAHPGLCPECGGQLRNRQYPIE